MKISIFMSILFLTPVWAFMSKSAWHMVALTYSFKILSFNIHRSIKISCIDRACISLLLNINISLKTVTQYSNKIKIFLMAHYSDLSFYEATQKTHFLWTTGCFWHVNVRGKKENRGQCTYLTAYFSNGAKQCCYVDSMWDNFKAGLVASFFSFYLGSQFLP